MSQTGEAYYFGAPALFSSPSMPLVLGWPFSSPFLPHVQCVFQQQPVEGCYGIMPDLRPPHPPTPSQVDPKAVFGPAHEPRASSSSDEILSGGLYPVVLFSSPGAPGNVDSGGMDSWQLDKPQRIVDQETKAPARMVVVLHYQARKASEGTAHIRGLRGRPKKGDKAHAPAKVSARASNYRQADFQRGCWTCKCRRKKCDRRKPACYTCEQLGISCYGFSPTKPIFMSSRIENMRYREHLSREISGRRKVTTSVATINEVP